MDLGAFGAHLFWTKTLHNSIIILFYDANTHVFLCSQHLSVLVQQPDVRMNRVTSTVISVVARRIERDAICTE